MNKFGIRMKEHPVGDVFTWYGKKIKVIDAEKFHMTERCVKCIFYEKFCTKIPCLPTERSDNKNVYYKKVE